MMPAFGGFLSDPKNWIALSAFVLSVINFSYSFVNNRRQNRRWHELNRPRLRLVNPRLEDWAELDRKELTNGLIDYDLLAYNIESSTERVRAHGHLVVHDTETGQRHYGHAPVFTVPEAEAEARRLGLTPPFMVVQFIKFVFPIRNAGKTDAHDVTMRIEALDAQNQPVELDTYGPDGSLGPDEEVFLTAPFGIPLEASAPNEATFVITFTYRDEEGNSFKERITRRWTRAENYWHATQSKRIVQHAGVSAASRPRAART
jgi:hypothetical protein